MEIKEIKINTKTDFVDYKTQKVIKIYINEDNCKLFCLTLMLLKEELVNEISLILDGFNFVFKLNKNKKNKSSNCIFIDGSIKQFNGLISINHLGYFLSFVLKYYRDGIGEAEHIDIDFIDINGVDVTLNIKCEQFTEYIGENLLI